MAAPTESGHPSGRCSPDKEGDDGATTATALTVAEDTDGGSSVDQEDLVNPVRDTLAEGIVGMLRPSLEKLDLAVLSTKNAQQELRQHISQLEAQLRDIEQQEPCPVQFESYIQKLNSAKKRVTVVNNILQGAQERLARLHQGCVKETAKRRAMIEPSPASTPTTTEPLQAK